MTPIPCLLAEGQDLGFDVAIDHGIWRLERGDGSDGLGALHLGDAEVGDADPADFAFALEVGHGGPAFFDLVFGHGPVDLVEVDDIELEAAETCFQLLGGWSSGCGGSRACRPRRMEHLVKT